MNSKHLEKTRQLMKKNYYHNHGKEKSLLKYYVQRYCDDSHVHHIAKDDEIPFTDKINLIKVHLLEQRMKTIKMSD